MAQGGALKRGWQVQKWQKNQHTKSHTVPSRSTKQKKKSTIPSPNTTPDFVLARTVHATHLILYSALGRGLGLRLMHPESSDHPEPVQNAKMPTCGARPAQPPGPNWRQPPFLTDHVDIPHLPWTQLPLVIPVGFARRSPLVSLRHDGTATQRMTYASYKSILVPAHLSPSFKMVHRRMPRVYLIRHGQCHVKNILRRAHPQARLNGLSMVDTPVSPTSL